MKYIFSIIFLFISCIARAQYIPNSGAYQYKGLKQTNSLQPPTGTGLPVTSVNAPDSSYAGLYYNKADTSFYQFNPIPKTWTKLAGSGGSSEILPAGPFTTSNTQVGYDPGSNLTAAQIIAKVWYGLKPPTATLTGGTQLEYIGTSTSAQTLAWSAHRQSNTATLSSTVVAGISQTFSQPGQPGTVSGTQAVSVPANTSTTYSNIVTASDGQADTATTTFTFAPRKYYGWISDTTGIASGSQDAVIRALTSALSNSKGLSVNTGLPGGTKFFVYAYLTSLGSITSITFNGIPADDAMNTVTESFTTAAGFTGNYTIIYNKNGQTTSSDVIFQ